MKVLFHLNQLGYGGTEKAVLTFCQNFNLSTVTPYLYLYQKPEIAKLLLTKTFAPFFQKARLRYDRKYVRPFVRHDAFKKILGSERIFCGGLHVFKRCVNEIKPDIIHFNRGDWSKFYEDAIQVVPTQTACVETNIFGVPPGKTYFERLSRFYFVSHWLKNKSTWHTGKGKVLFNPIKLPATDTDLQKSLRIPDNAFILGRISRPDMHDDKFILNVFQKLDQKKVVLLVIAASPIIREKAKQQKNIICLDPTVDEVKISQFYNTIDLLLHRRVEGETFGMNIAEAMIHSKAVVSHRSRIDNAQGELLSKEEFGVVGSVANVDNVEEYLSHIKTYIDDGNFLKSSGKNAQKKASYLYGEEVITRFIEREYTILLKKP